MAKKRYLRAVIPILYLALFPHLTLSAPYIPGWSAQPGTSADEVSEAIANDSLGNVYIGGQFGATFLVPPAPGSINIEHGFVAKYTNSGAPVWSVPLALGDFSNIYGMTADVANNVLVTGFAGSTNISGTSSAPFIRKYNGNGTALWTTFIGSIGSSLAVASDSLANAYIVGNTSNSNLSNALINKYNSAGALQWNRTFGASAGDQGTAVSVDKFDNIFVTGSTGGNFAGTTNGGIDGFLVKYDTTGNQIWKTQFGTSAGDSGTGVTTDAAGNIYVTGITDGDFAAPPAGGLDGFVVKFDPAGNILWKKQFGTSNAERPANIALDSLGHIFIGGSLNSFSPGADAFLTEFESDGSFAWQLTVGTAGQVDQGYDLGMDPFGNAYLTGGTRGNLAGTNAGGDDPFLLQFTVPEPASLSFLTLASLALLSRRRKPKSPPSHSQSQSYSYSSS